MEYYKHYLLGRQFVARTDHQALKWLYSLRKPKDRIARWLETLSAYQFSIEYQPSNKHGNANAMSRRCPNPQECKCPLLEEEILKCGPCQKCHQRAETMDSTLMDSQGNLRSMQVQGDEPVHMVQTHSQTKGQQRWLSQSWLQRAETEQSMAEWDIEGVTLGRSSQPEEVLESQGLTLMLEHHLIAQAHQGRSGHHLGRSHWCCHTQCRI